MEQEHRGGEAAPREALLDAVNERPAAPRAAALKDRRTFKTEWDHEAQRAVFPQDERLKV